MDEAGLKCALERLESDRMNGCDVDVVRDAFADLRARLTAAEQRAVEAEGGGKALEVMLTAAQEEVRTLRFERDTLKRAIAPVWPLDKPIQQYVELCARYRAKEMKVRTMDVAPPARRRVRTVDDSCPYCGKTTDDVAGGPCSKCWEKVK